MRRWFGGPPGRGLIDACTQAGFTRIVLILIHIDMTNIIQDQSINTVLVSVQHVAKVTQEEDDSSSVRSTGDGSLKRGV